MDLFILRHGEAGKSSDGDDDFSRPLTVAGATDVTRDAEWLKDLGVKFDAIISSLEAGASNCVYCIQDL